MTGQRCRIDSNHLSVAQDARNRRSGTVVRNTSQLGASWKQRQQQQQLFHCSLLQQNALQLLRHHSALANSHQSSQRQLTLTTHERHTRSGNTKYQVSIKITLCLCVNNTDGCNKKHILIAAWIKQRRVISSSSSV